MNANEHSERINTLLADVRPRCATCVALRAALIWQIEEHPCCADEEQTVAALALDCPHAAQQQVVVALETFLADFPDNTTSWAQATGELPDMYVWLREVHNLLLLGENDPLVPVGRENCQTPAEWNRKYKEAIRLAFGRLDANLIERFAKRFSEWLSARKVSP